MKEYSFYFHYNKPASLVAKKPKLSVHFKNSCIIVDKIDCRVKIVSRNKKTQPRCVMAGKAFCVLEVKNKEDDSLTAIIN